ncbi:GAF domain-containing protein [Gordonia bronchialis]|uniref:GAF domain-containing protein n=1 Tax=Gordonia bronchialis TaxID=2054 RepID=UPI00019B9EDB|nr:GAF domain-containing protein [Gordonia bronchialis]MCC3323735.1 GAF domain-containing protein [Gordonia bronchialis]
MTVSADPPSTLLSRERAVIAAFSQVTTEAITDAKLEDLLTLVGRRLCRLLGVTRCSVYLRHGSGRYRGAAGYCQEAGDITQAVRRQESGFDGDRFSQEVITTRQPVVITDALNDPRPHHRTMAHWDVRAMLGVPLIFDDEVIGLIFVDSRGRGHEFTTEDIEVATLFARLSAIFISQAMLNSRLRRQAAEIARNNATLAYLADVHTRLTNAVLEGANIARVVQLLSELSAKPVVLYNNDFDVLTWSAPEALKLDAPPVLSAKVRNTPSVRATLAELSVTTPSAVVPAQLAVGLGRRHLMCRMVIEGSRAALSASWRSGAACRRSTPTSPNAAPPCWPCRCSPNGVRSRPRDRPATITSPTSCATDETRNIWSGAARSSASTSPTRMYWCASRSTTPRDSCRRRRSSRW